VNDDSAIDVAVIVDELNIDILEAQALLYKLRRDLDLRIEPVLLLENKDRSGFLEEVLKIRHSGLLCRSIR